ncbi:MAG: VanZ family protein [Butyribacter sp.]|nr:VanZ family protein [bacterium]MDY3855171.1 VanZ family protein [Butyribacter sp.]
MKKKNRRILHVFSWILFIIYLVVMVYFLFFSEQFGRVPSDEYHYNLEPFAEIKRYTSHIKEIGYFYVIINLAGNIICFMPLGFVLPVLSHKKWGVFRITCISFLASLLIELTQLFSKLGSCDVDDIFMNTCGGLLGYILFLICNRIYHIATRKKKTRRK